MTPDASGRFVGMAVPADAPWPAARELTAGGYVPADAPRCPDCGGDGRCLGCHGSVVDPEDCGDCQGAGSCGYCCGDGVV